MNFDNRKYIFKVIGLYPFGLNITYREIGIKVSRPKLRRVINFKTNIEDRPVSFEEIQYRLKSYHNSVVENKQVSVL